MREDLSMPENPDAEAIARMRRGAKNAHKRLNVTDKAIGDARRDIATVTRELILLRTTVFNLALALVDAGVVTMKREEGGSTVRTFAPAWPEIPQAKSSHCEAVIEAGRRCSRRAHYDIQYTNGETSSACTQHAERVRGATDVRDIVTR